MHFSDIAISTLFLIFLALFLLISNSPALQRWLEQIVGAGEKAAESSDPVQVESVEGEETGKTDAPTPDVEALIFQQLALAGVKGISLTYLVEHLRFERPVLGKALAAMARHGTVRRAGLLGRKFQLSQRGRQHAIQEGIIPRLYTDPHG